MLGLIVARPQSRQDPIQGLLVLAHFLLRPVRSICALAYTGSAYPGPFLFSAGIIELAQTVVTPPDCEKGPIIKGFLDMIGTDMIFGVLLQK